MSKVRITHYVLGLWEKILIRYDVKELNVKTGRQYHLEVVNGEIDRKEKS